MKTQWTSTIRLRVRFPRKQAPVLFGGTRPFFRCFVSRRFGCLISLWFAPRRRGWLGGAANSYLWLNIDLTCPALPCLVLYFQRKQNVTLNKYFLATLQKMNFNVKLVKITIFKYLCQLVWKSNSQASFCCFFLQWLLFSQEGYHKPAYHKCLTVLLGIHMLLICLFFGRCSNIDWRTSRFIPIKHSTNPF